MPPDWVSRLGPGRLIGSCGATQCPLFCPLQFASGPRGILATRKPFPLSPKRPLADRAENSTSRSQSAHPQTPFLARAACRTLTVFLTFVSPFLFYFIFFIAWLPVAVPPLGGLSPPWLCAGPHTPSIPGHSLLCLSHCLPADSRKAAKQKAAIPWILLSQGD